MIAAALIPEVVDDRLPRWEYALHTFAQRSCEAYQELIYRTPELETYFWEATPIDLIEHLRIGSRPSRRQQTRDLRQLRAIPWVFSWTQSRHLLPAWYGMGHAFATADEKGRDELREMYAAWPFFSSVIDNAELSLAKTDLYIASRYAQLCSDAKVSKKIFEMIEAEYDRTVRWVLAISGRTKLLENQPVLEESIRLRNPYIDPLNYLQLRFLPEWRLSTSRPEELRRLLALTVTGIAFGMKSTG